MYAKMVQISQVSCCVCKTESSEEPIHYIYLKYILPISRYINLHTQAKKIQNWLSFFVCIQETYQKRISQRKSHMHIQLPFCSAGKIVILKYMLLSPTKYYFNSVNFTKYPIYIFQYIYIYYFFRGLILGSNHST